MTTCCSTYSLTKPVYCISGGLLALIFSPLSPWHKSLCFIFKLTLSRSFPGFSYFLWKNNNLLCVSVCRVPVLTILLAPSRCPLCHRSHAPRGWAHHPPGSPSCCPWSQRAHTGRSCAPGCPAWRKLDDEDFESRCVPRIVTRWLWIIYVAMLL